MKGNLSIPNISKMNFLKSGGHYNLTHVLIALVVILVIYKLGRQVVEGYTDSSSDIKSGGFDRPMDKYTLLDPYNYTQTEFIKLQNTLDTISSDNKKRLDNVDEYHKLIPATTDAEIIRELDSITDPILQKLNQLYSEQNYQSKFTKTDYDTIEIYNDNDNNLNIVYDVFIQEKQRFPYGIKLKIDIIKYNMNPRKPVGNNRIIKNLRNEDEDSRLPSYSLNNDILDIDGRKVIPSPVKALSTPHWPILDTVNWKPPQKSPVLQNIHINSIKLYNSDLIIHPDKPTNNINGGINDTTLEYNCYSNARNYRAEPNVISNKWIPLASEPKCLKQWPCVPVSQDWDRLGVKKPLQNETPLCNGIRSSTTQAPLRAEFNPTIHTNPRNEGLYSWLFDLYNKQGSSRNFI